MSDGFLQSTYPNPAVHEERREVDLRFEVAAGVGCVLRTAPLPSFIILPTSL